MLRHRPASPNPQDDDDILCEILLRLPPRPSSLPRASLVSRRWRRLVSDPGFLRRFRAHHRTPPLLGFYAGVTFFPALDPPDRVPAARFSLDPSGDEEAARKQWRYKTCCHGLVLSWTRAGFAVFDPMSGHRHSVPYPTSYEQKKHLLCLGSAAVTRAASGDRRLFRIVALFSEAWKGGGFTSVYSSESGVWEDPVAVLPEPSTEMLTIIVRQGTLLGSAIYWILDTEGVIEFDLDRQSLTVIEPPPDADAQGDSFKSQIISAEVGQLGLAVLSEHGIIKFWERETNHGCHIRWVLRKTVQSDNFLPLGCSPLCIVGYSEESKVMFLMTDTGVFMVQIDTLESRKVLKESKIHHVHPYSSF